MLSGTIKNSKQQTQSNLLKSVGIKTVRTDGFRSCAIPHVPSELLLPSAENFCPDRLNWPGWLAGISEGARGISK